MASYSIWNLIQPQLELRIKGYHIAKQVKIIMKDYMLSDEKVFYIKDALQNEMDKGFNCSEEKAELLPMRITYVTERFKETRHDRGNYVSICIHSQQFIVTLVKFKPNSVPEIYKKDYFLDQNILKLPNVKIYDAFANCVKDFFIEYDLDGDIIPTSICTDLSMKQYSLDTAVISNFIPGAKISHNEKDIKASFEQVLQKDEYQGEANLIESPKSLTSENVTGSANTDRVYHVMYEATILEKNYVKCLTSTLDSCHSLLSNFQSLEPASNSEETISKLSLDISNSGIKVFDKAFKNTLYNHPIHKISKIVQDFKDSHVFGYLYGDFLDGHQFFGFKTLKKSTEIISVLRDVFATELVKKKKGKLEMQASQVFLILEGFINLSYELKSREIEMPQLLQKRINMVENINWWLEGCFEEPETACKEPKELLLNVRLQDLYAAACQIKELKIQREEAARLEQDKLSGIRRRRKRKGKADKTPEEDYQEEEAPDPLLVKISEIFSVNKEYLESTLENLKLLLKDIMKHLETLNVELTSESDFTSLKDGRELCFSFFNAWRKENVMLLENIKKLTSFENSERNKIKYEVSSICTGKKQHLKVTKNAVKNRGYEDIDFTVPKRIDKAKSDLLDKVLVCEEYFLNSLKMRREEVQDLNYFISELFFRENINNPEDSKAIEFCRRLFIKAIKMRLNEIDDIEEKLKELKNAESKILFMAVDIIEFILRVFKSAVKRRNSNLPVVERKLSSFPVGIEPSDENINVIFNILSELKDFIEKDIENVKNDLTEIQEKEISSMEIANLCFMLYNQTLTMRKKEFHTAISELDLFESIDIDSGEDKEFTFHCQEEYITSACMREIEIEGLEFQIKTVDKVSKSQNDFVVTLKDLFDAAIEMEKWECEKILNSSVNRDSSEKALPVVYNFKELFEIVVQYLNKENLLNTALPLKTPKLYTSMREFLLAAFELKQKQVEIPVSVLKSDFQNILMNLIQEVKKRHRRKQLQAKISDQAMKISESWKEVFLLAIEMRNKEVEEIVSFKKCEIKEEAAILNSLKDKDHENADNEASKVVKILKTIFSAAIKMKYSEVKEINQILKSSVADKRELMIKTKTENTAAVDDLDEEKYFEPDDANTLTKKESPSEEVLNAISSCKHIYNIAVNKGSTQLEELEHEMRSIFSDEYEEDKVDVVVEDEVTVAIKSSSNIISDFIDSIKEEVSAMKINLESLIQVEENIKSQVTNAKSTATHFLTLLLELEENAVINTEEKLKKISKAFQDLQAKGSESFRPFTDLKVDVLSEDELSQSDSEKSKNESELSDVEENQCKKLTKDEINSVLLDIGTELENDSDEEERLQIHEAAEFLKVFMDNLELSSERRRIAINSIYIEIEKLKLPDPKKLKSKEKVKRALKFIVTCKEIFLNSAYFRQSELRSMQADLERMKATQRKEQIVIEFEASEIIRNCRDLFHSAVEIRKKNIFLMKDVTERLNSKESHLPEDIKNEEKSSIKSEIYVICKDLVLESVDLKMKEIDDIASHMEVLNSIELKIGSQLKHLDPEKNKSACMKLEKAKDAVATCKKLCSSAIERAKKEVRETDEELELLKRALETSETSLITATCKNLLMSGVERRDAEITELELQLSTLLEDIENLSKKLEDLTETKNPSSEKENLNLDEEPSKQTSQSDVNVQSKPTDEDLRDTHSDPTDVEEISKQKISMVTDFLTQCKEILLNNIVKRKDKAANLESDLEKLKITVQKVEAEDQHVFSICQSIYAPIIEMRFEEIKSFKTEIKAVQILNNEITSISSTKKAEDKPEESEVSLALASCRRLLSLAIKNRKSEKDTIDFELMKLVRFQDSRIINISKQFLLTTLQKASEEMGAIKTQLMNIESLPQENESEILYLTEEILENLSKATEQQINVFGKEMQLLAKKKLQMEIEESQFVLVVKKHFLSQVNMCLKEITVLRQELDSLFESQNFEQGFEGKILNLKYMHEKIYEKAISDRNKEIDDFQFELIKHYDIKVSEEISTFERYLQTFIDEVKNELKICESETEKIANVGSVEENAKSEADMIWTTLRRLQKNYGASFKKRNKDCHVIEEMLSLLQGKKLASEEEQKFDVLSPLKQEACFEKLKTDGSVTINACKEILYSVIEVAENEIHSISVAKEELKRQEKDENVQQKKEAFNFQDDPSEFSEKELALLEALAFDVSISESTKNQKVAEFCEKFLEKSAHLRETLIQTAKQFLEKLSDIEEELVFQASKLVYFMTNLMKSFLDEQMKEKKRLQNYIRKLEEIKAKEKYEDQLLEISAELQEILVETSAFKEDLLVILKLTFESLKKKEEELRIEVSLANRNCGDLLVRIMELMESNMKHLIKDLESLKEFGLADEDDEDDSNLSEDEKAVKKCNLLLLAAIDERKKLIQSVNLELKFLKGGVREMRKEDSKVFPSWRNRFLTFIGLENEAEETINLTSSIGDNLMKTEGTSYYHSVPDNSDVQAAEHFKDLLKSLEEKRKKQPIYIISSWDDLFLRSFLKEQINKSSLELTEKQSFEDSEDIIKERNWEDLFYEADHLLKKQVKLSEELKERKQFFLPIATWSEVFCKAISEWSSIMEEECENIKNEALLIQWKGNMKSKENLEYSHSSKYGYQSKAFDQLLMPGIKDHVQIPSMDASSTDLDSGIISQPVENVQSSDNAAENGNKNLSTWNYLFSKSIDLLEGSRKAMNFMRKKSTKLQSQVISIFSSWDELFSKAIEQRKNELKDEMKENDAMKSLAKVINEEIQGKAEEYSTKPQDRKFESWIQIIYDTSEVHKSKLLGALNAKKSEMEKLSGVNFTTDVYSISHSFLTQNPKNILNQCRTLLTIALEIRKKEIIEMEKELKLVKELSDNTKAKLKEFPRPVLIWKLIVSCAVIFKTSGQKFEPFVKMHFRQNSEHLLAAAMKSKMEELENFEIYWKRFTEKQRFLDITPTSISWNEVLSLISELAAKDITKMSKFGIKAEAEFDELKANENLNVDISSEVPENVACWSDLVLEFIEAENPGDKSFDSSSTSSDFLTKNVNVLSSWDEIFFFMNQMQRDAIKEKIFVTNNSPVDSSKLQDIRNMVSCKFFTWDILISGVLEEILWAIQEMSENEGTVSMDKNKNVHGLPFINTVSDFKVEGNIVLKDILKKFGLKSYSELLPDKVGAKKFDMVDILNKSRHGIANPDKVSELKEFKEEDIWRHLFPIAVEVWHKSMQNYLSFEALDDVDNCGIGSSLNAQNSEPDGSKSGADSKQLNFDFNVLESIERVVAFDYISRSEGSVDKNFSHFNEEKEKIISMVSSGEFPINIIEDMNEKFQDGEKINPEFFSVSASWHEMLKAALKSRKKFLNQAIDLQENEDCKEPISCSTDKGQGTSEKQALKFNAANVLNQEITLQDLFEIVDVLKSKSLITVKKIESSYNQVLDVNNNTSGNLDVSNVMDSFIKFFRRSFMSRLNEEKFVKTEIGKLSTISLNNCEKSRVYPVIVQLIHHIEKAVKLRNEENESITLKLDSLKEFKSIFSVYLECPVTESLMKRNQRFVDEMIDVSNNLKLLQESLMEKFQRHLSSLIRKSENYLKRRRANAQLCDMERVNYLLNKVPLEDQEMFSNLMEIFNSMSELWKKEFKDLHQQIIDYKMNKYDHSIEENIRMIISNILTFFEKEMFERENLVSLLSNEKDFLLEREADLKSKISLMFTNCKAFLDSSITNSEKEISTVNEGMTALNGVTNQPNKKTLELLSLCKEYCEKFVEKRESEIATLKEYINGLKEEEVSGIQTVCLEYYSQASINLKSDQKIIDEHIESFKLLGENVESVIYEAIDEALADVVDLSGGRVFLHTTGEAKESEEDKIDSEVVMKCLEFFDNRKENVKFEMKALDENAELIRFYKSDTSEIITILHKFTTVLNRVLQDIKKDSDRIKAERKFIENYQSSFNLEILGYLIDCRKHFEENLRDVEQDIYILKLQLSILSEDQENIFDDISLSTSSPFKDVDLDYKMQDSNASEIATDLSKHAAESSSSEESIILENCHKILKSALDLRVNHVTLFSNEMKVLNDAESKAFQTLTTTMDNISNMIEKRKSEKKSVEAMLLPVETVSTTDVLYTCVKCLSSLQQYTIDCLTAVMPDFNRLESTLLSMEKKRLAIFSFCDENLESVIALRTDEVEFMNSELVSIDSMQTSDDSYYVTSSKLIFKNGVEARNSEILVMKNAVKTLKSATEILPIVDLCRQHFQTCVRNRKEEVASIEKQIGLLKDEAEMLFLLYAPAFQSLLQRNKEALENLVAVVQKLYRISRELNAEEEKILLVCQTLYSCMLETVKIEREAIKHDVDSLQEVEMEKKDVIDTEGKELEVSFKDLYLTAFNLKKSDLEKNIKKKNIEDNVKTKKTEIIKSLKTTKSKENAEEVQSDPVSNNAVELDTKSTDESFIDNEDNKQEMFAEFIGYYDIKKEKRKLMIENKIMTEFEDIEKTFDPRSQESFDMSKYSEESLEEIPETKPTEQAFNRVYEVKMKEVEEKIRYRHEKITGVINVRKHLLENVVLTKKKELERNISLKENEMRSVIDSIKGKQSAVVCSLKDLYHEILDLKRVFSDSLYLETIDEKFIAAKYKAYPVSVKLEKFIDIVLEIKELELQMLLQSKCKDVDKIVNRMKKEVEKLIVSSKEQLEEEIKQYRKSEKARAMEYAVSGGSMSQKDEYVIKDDKIFPDVNSFEEYAKSFKGFFVPPPKKVIIYEDKTFRSDEVLKNDPTHLPLCRCLPFSNCVPNHVLKFLEVEINSLTKIISEMNLDRAKAILHGLSFLSAETISDVSAKRMRKEILLDIVSILNDCTSMLVRGSATDQNCEISLNLESDCSLVYFEKIENVKKWCPLLENVTEVAIDVGLKHFGKADYLDEISTKFDFAVTTEPMHSSRLGRFISDIGLLEQIKFVFLELYHHHLLCRDCSFESCGLSYEHILKLFNLRNNEFELVGLLPLSSGTPSPIDVTIASYVCRIVLMRGALVTAICLSNIVQRLSKNKITIITSSYFIGESSTYQKMLKIYLSYLSPGKKVDFMFSKKNHCGIGAALMSSVASEIKRENPGLYLLELEQHLDSRKKLFSTQSFMKLLSDPNFSQRAVELAERYMKEMKFDLPLAVVWAYHFINGNVKEAEDLYKCYPISLSKVCHLVYRKISCDKDLDLAKLYVKFLKTVSGEQSVKESAYRILLDILFLKNLYDEAGNLVQECIDNKIPLTKLRHSTLVVLHDLCKKQSRTKERLPYFPLPKKDFDDSSYDSTDEENN